ncbi:MAG: nucleotide-binding protein [Porticoccaceae bacterium]|nr:MAG: nucleotide-binding protein [Porticoccaceae bacterium]
MRLLVVSGRSGSGKSTALHVLEDVGFTCIDNLPAGLLPALVDELGRGGRTRVAVGIDVRTPGDALHSLPARLASLKAQGVHCEVLYLDCADPVLLRRFSETRRRHPLTGPDVDLPRALALERDLLEPVLAVADCRIDTTSLTLHELRDVVQSRVAPERHGQTSVLFLSFGYKHGVPADADFVFDVRCLPNPHWMAGLRQQTGLDAPVAAFLAGEPQVAALEGDLIAFLARWLPELAASGRSYLTVALGCTGGQHRSVYLAERLARHFRDRFADVQVRHRELERAARPAP